MIYTVPRSGRNNTISFQKGEEKMMELAITGTSEDGKSFQLDYSVHSGFVGFETPGDMGYQTICHTTEFLDHIYKAQENGATNIVIEIKD